MKVKSLGRRVAAIKVASSKVKAQVNNKLLAQKPPSEEIGCHKSGVEQGVSSSPVYICPVYICPVYICPVVMSSIIMDFFVSLFLIFVI